MHFDALLVTSIGWRFYTRGYNQSKTATGCTKAALVSHHNQTTPMRIRPPPLRCLAASIKTVPHHQDMSAAAPEREVVKSFNALCPDKAKTISTPGTANCVPAPIKRRHKQQLKAYASAQHMQLPSPLLCCRRCCTPSAHPRAPVKVQTKWGRWQTPLPLVYYPALSTT